MLELNYHSRAFGYVAVLISSSSLLSETYSEHMQQLEKLVKTAESRQEKLRRGSHASKEVDRQRELWDRQCNILNKMKIGLEKLRQ